MFQNVVKCSEMVLNCFKKQNVPKRLEKSELSKNVPRGPQTSRDILRLSKLFKNVPKYSKTFRTFHWQLSNSKVFSFFHFRHYCQKLQICIVVKTLLGILIIKLQNSPKLGPKLFQNNKLFYSMYSIHQIFILSSYFAQSCLVFGDSSLWENFASC